MTLVESLRDALPVRDRAAVEHARADADRRPIAYPLGSGQAEEVALSIGLRPLIRQVLQRRDLGVARARFERSGFTCEVAPRVYGPSRDGWDGAKSSLPPDAPGARQALFVGRDRARVEEAVACDVAKTDEADRALGRLLGYPRCCVEAFVATSAHRFNTELYARAVARTRGAAHPRLNGLDLAIFHFVSWSPCAFDCALSLAYADAVAARLQRTHAPFVTAVDAALAAPRLVLLDEVQLSLRAERDGEGYLLRDAWPTARDRHPHIALDADAREAVARALALVRGAARLATTPRGLLLDGALLAGTEGAFVAPFGLGAPAG